MAIPAGYGRIRYAALAMTSYLVPLSIGGMCLGYLVGALVWTGFMSLPFLGLYAFAIPVFALWAITITLTSKVFSPDFPMNRPDSIERVLKFAPLWSKALPVISIAVSFGVPIIKAGGSLQVASWEAAQNWERAIFFVAIACFYAMPLPLLLAVRERRITIP